MNCLICSKECHIFIDKKLQTESCFCEYCHAVFKSSENFQAFDEQERRYDLHQNSEESEGYRAYFKRFLDFVLPFTGSVRSALDFGSGASALLATMLGEVGIACDRYDPIYHPDLLYRKKRYDLIVSVEVFEHLHDPKKVFGELLSRLNPGGYLALQTQFHLGDIEKYMEWYYRLDPTHIVFFAPETFHYLADLYGCRYCGDNGKNMVVFEKKEAAESSDLPQEKI